VLTNSLIILEKFNIKSKKYIKNINKKTKFKFILKKEKMRNKNNKINVLINKKLKLEFSKVWDIFGVVNLFIGK
jgi:UDP-3-O-[3-hydroxymyristoyl] glucosamine N-acyltransferase